LPSANHHIAPPANRSLAFRNEGTTTHVRVEASSDSDESRDRAGRFARKMVVRENALDRVGEHERSGGNVQHRDLVEQVIATHRERPMSRR
jgi:hypothetical protein